MSIIWRRHARPCLKTQYSNYKNVDIYFPQYGTYFFNFCIKYYGHIFGTVFLINIS